MNDLDCIRVIPRSEAIRVLNLSTRTWDRLEREGNTPPKTQLSEKRVGYRVSDLRDWLDSRRRGVAA
jgi:predicted DNA-binding transcriptional regulator AlpA